MKMYHRDVFIPANVREDFPLGVQSLIYTNHAKRASDTDRYGKLPILRSIRIFASDIIEAGTDDYGRLVHILVRTSLNRNLDICLAIKLEDNLFIVKTVWFNEQNDSHATLDTSKYERAA